MHIREHGKCIQMLRSTYDQVTKRGVQKLVASLPSDAAVIPDKVKSLLSPEELQHLKDYLELMKAVKTQNRQRQNLDTIATSLTDSIAALSFDGLSLESSQVSEIWTAIDAFSLALKKAGYAKPPKPRKGEAT